MNVLHGIMSLEIITVHLNRKKKLLFNTRIRNVVNVGCCIVLERRLKNTLPCVVYMNFTRMIYGHLQFIIEFYWSDAICITNGF